MALDEIKKNEKETNMIAMVAQTLFEKSDGLQSKLAEVEQELVEVANSQMTSEQKYTDLESTYLDTLSNFEQLELIKAEMDKEMSSLISRKDRYEKRCEMLDAKRKETEEATTLKD